jgi:hypothetical protein
MAKRLDDNGTLYLLSKLLLLFQRQEAGKGLSTNDLTDALKQAILNQFDGTWGSLTGKPTAISAWTNDVEYQTATQVASKISTEMAASGFQTATQVEAAIEDALFTLDTAIFEVVSELPEVGEANTNKIYIVAGDGTEWFVKNGAWEPVGEASVSLDGYFNEENLVAISNAEIDAIIAGLLD